MFNEITRAMACVYGALLVSLITYSIAQALVARTLGHRFDELSIGYVPVLQVRVFQAKWKLGLIPLGSYVRFGPPDFDNTYTAAPFLHRCLITLAGPVSMLMLAVGVLGRQGFDSAAQTYLQMFDTVASLNPFPVKDWFRTYSFWKVVAVVAAKTAALNMLPAPYMAGGVFLREVLEALSGRKFRHDAQWSLMLWLSASWAVFGIFIWRFLTGVAAWGPNAP